MKHKEYALGRAIQNSSPLTLEVERGHVAQVTIPLGGVSDERINQLSDALIIEVNNGIGLINVCNNQGDPIYYQSQTAAKSAAEDLKSSLYKKVAFYFAHQFEVLVIWPDQDLISISNL